MAFLLWMATGVLPVAPASGQRFPDCPPEGCAGPSVASPVWIDGTEFNVSFLPVRRPVSDTYYYCHALDSREPGFVNGYDILTALGLISRHDAIRHYGFGGIECYQDLRITQIGGPNDPRITTRELFGGPARLRWTIQGYIWRCKIFDEEGKLIQTAPCGPSTSTEIASVDSAHWVSDFTIEMLPHPGGRCRAQEAAAANGATGRAGVVTVLCVLALAGAAADVLGVELKAPESWRKWITVGTANLNATRQLCLLELFTRDFCVKKFGEDFDKPMPKAEGVYSRAAGSWFTDDPLVPTRTVVRSVHFTELRGRIDDLRERLGMSPFAWTDPTLTGGATPIRAVHLTQLRTGLSDVYAEIRRPAPAWADDVQAGVTGIRAQHVEELRAALMALEDTDGVTTLTATSSAPDVIEAAMVGYDLYLRPNGSGTAVITIQTMRDGTTLPIALEVSLTI